MLEGKLNKQIQPASPTASRAGSVCAQCGAVNEEGATFCASCGGFLEWNRTPGETSEVDPGVAQPLPVTPDPQTPGVDPVAAEGSVGAAGEGVPPASGGRTVALAIEASPDDLPVEPGGEASCEVRIRNTGTIVDRVTLQVSGPGASWASPEPPTLNIYPGETGVARVHFRPPRSPQTRAGAFPFEVIATSTEDPGVAERAPVRVNLAPYFELSGRLQPQGSEARRSAHHEVILENAGNAPLAVTVAGDGNDDLSLAVGRPGVRGSMWHRLATWIVGHHRETPPLAVSIGPGETQEADLGVIARQWNLSGPPRDHTFVITGTANEGAALTLQGTLTQRGLVPSFVPRILMALVPLLAVLIAFLLLTSTVPDVATQPAGAAVASLTKAGFKVTSQPEPSDTVDPGKAIKTDPGAGSLRKSHTGVTMFVSSGPKLVAVPAGLANLDVDNARLQLTQAHLVVTELQEPNDTIASGKAVGTDPPANTLVKQGSSVQLHISTGPPPVAIPAVVGLGQTAAADKLRAAGFVAILITEPSSSRLGNVTRTDPLPGSMAPKGSPVNLYVSGGPGSSGNGAGAGGPGGGGSSGGGSGGGGGGNVTVPQVTGMDQATASAKLKGDGFQVTTASEANPAPAGTVIRTAPAAGAEAAKGSTVMLVLSSGAGGPPPPGGVPVPGVAGSNLAAAQAKLTAAGFQVATASEVGALPKGQVSRTDPAANTPAAKGSIVTVYLSLGKIVFMTTRDGNAQIYAMNADGSAPTRLTTNSASEDAPAMSPDGRRVAFSSNRDGNQEIYVMNADGSGQTRLTTNATIDNYPTWAPDGQRIMFASNRNGNFDIYVMNADGSGQTQLTNNPAVDTHPAWSPDGQHIAFVSTRDGDSQIYVMNPDGSGQTRLTTAPANSYPAWSPDSHRLAFISARDGNNEIYVMNANGTAQTRLTTTTSAEDAPTWSPDGMHIAFDSNRSGNYAVFVMNADGSGVSNLSAVGRTSIPTSAANDLIPSW